MKSIVTVAALCLMAGAGLVQTPLAAASATRAPADPAQLAAITESSARGLEMFDLHQAAAIAEAAMKKAVPRERQATIAGWIVEPGAQVDKVTFYGLKTGVPYPIYAAGIAAGKVSYAGEVPAADSPPLTPFELRMIGARQTGAASSLTRCNKEPFDVLVFPPTGLTAPAQVYLLTAKPDASSYPLGGHYLLTLDADNKVTDTRAFPERCVNAFSSGGGAIHSVIDDQGIDVPSEFDVYLSLSTRFPITVRTRLGVWYINGAHIQKWAETKPKGNG